MNGHDVVHVARQWLDVPFKHRGRDRRGLDCAGLIIVVAKELGLAERVGFKDELIYARQPTTGYMQDQARKYLQLVRTREPRVGDILHFAFSTLPQHMAIYTESNTIIHAYDSGRRRVMEVTYTGKWPKALSSIYRFRGLEWPS